MFIISNKKELLEAVKSNGFSLKNASEELKNNYEIVLEAIQNNYEALQYADDSDKSSLALLQSYIAEVYLSLKNNAKAEEYLEKAIENSTLSNDTNSLIWAYSSLGRIQVDKNNYTAAENYFKKALNLAQKSEFKLARNESTANFLSTDPYRLSCRFYAFSISVLLHRAFYLAVNIFVL
jgi:tetratricopeptide (TPR) repeat protein